MAKSHESRSHEIREQHHFYQLINAIDYVDIDALSQSEMRAIVKVAEKIVERSFVAEEKLESPQQTKLFLKLALSMEPNETFYVLFLNNRHGVIKHEPMFFGTIDGAAVYPRVVVKRALDLGAAAIIVAHQHPSGECAPSQADKRVTEKLRDALALVDIRLIDHIIIAGSDYTSFADTGLL